MARAQAEKIAEDITRLAEDPELEGSVSEISGVIEEALRLLAARADEGTKPESEANPVTEDESPTEEAAKTHQDRTPLLAKNEAPVHIDCDEEEELPDRHKDLIYLSVLTWPPHSRYVI